MIRLIIVVLALLAGGLSYADTDTNIRVNRIEMAEAPPDDSDTNDEQVKATDYNSSRSNKADGAKESDDSSVEPSDEKTDTSDDTEVTDATDHNSSRSQK